FDRKTTVVACVKFPAPSVARPVIVMLPPEPEFAGNVIFVPWLKLVTVVLKMVSVWAMVGSEKVTRISFRPRLSDASTLNCTLFAICCVSAALSAMAGEIRSNCTPPGFRAVSHAPTAPARSEEHTSELQSRGHLVCRLLLEKKKE